MSQNLSSAAVVIGALRVNGLKSVCGFDNGVCSIWERVRKNVLFLSELLRDRTIFYAKDDQLTPQNS